MLLNNEICSQHEGPSWPWSYGSWIYNYLCNQCTDVVSSNRDQGEVYNILASCWCFFPGPPVSSTNKTDRHDIAEILLKVALNTIIIINQSFKICSIKLMFEWVDMSIRRVMFQWTSSWSSHTVPVNKSMKIPKSLSQLSHPLSLLMFEWVDMSIRGVMFQCDNTIKI